MARTNNLTNFLTDVAAAIKNKKGSQTDIPASQFDTEITNLPSGGTYQHKTVSVTQNGTSTIVPDSGYDAIDELVINTAVPEKQLQTKTYTFTQNANLELTPDTGYDGFNQVNLNINVPTSGSTSNIYKFATLAEAQAKNDYNIGDIAVVMGKKRVPFYPALWKTNTANDDLLEIRFNQTVTFEETPEMDLDETWSTTSSGKTTTHPLKITITSSQAEIVFPVNIGGDSTNIFVWTSQDGLTYTYSYSSQKSEATTPRLNRLWMLYSGSSTTQTMIDKFKNDWSHWGVLSKFFSFEANDIVDNYYRYDGVYDNTFNLSFYPYDFDTLVYGGDNSPCDVLPMENLYTFDNSLLSNLSPISGGVSILDDGSDLYVHSPALMYNYVTGQKSIVQSNKTVYKIDKTTKTVTSLDLTDNSFTLINALR